MATRGEAISQPHGSRTGHGRPAGEGTDVTTAPELGVLDRRHLRERRQRRQARALVSISVLCVGLALLLAAVGHAVVASDQIRSDALQSEVASQLAVAQNSQLQRAELESPVRIETIAENQLYMVTPSAVTYVVPVKTGETVAQAHRDPTSPVLTSPSGRTRHHGPTRLKGLYKLSGQAPGTSSKPSSRISPVP
jgi:cell division protein FtsB